MPTYKVTRISKSESTVRAKSKDEAIQRGKGTDNWVIESTSFEAEELPELPAPWRKYNNFAFKNGYTRQFGGFTGYVSEEPEGQYRWHIACAGSTLDHGYDCPNAKAAAVQLMESLATIAGTALDAIEGS